MGARELLARSSAERFTALPMVWVKTATRTATPRRKPSRRAVLRMPEAAPLRLRGYRRAHAGGGEGRQGKAETCADERRAPQHLGQRGAARFPSANRPTALRRAPVTANGRGPRRSTRRPANGARIRPAAGRVATASPAFSSEYSIMAIMKMTSMKAVPIMATSTVMMAALAAAKVRLRKRRRSKSGAEACSSQATKRAISVAAAAKSPRIWMRARPPPPVVAFDKAQCEAEEPGGAEADAEPVQPGVAPPRRPRRDKRQRQSHGKDAQRHAEPEDCRPAPALDEDAAKHRSKGRGGRAQRPEEAGREPLLAGRGGVQKQRQRGRDHRGRPNCLHDAEGDEHVDRPCGRAAERCQREHDEARDVHAPVPVAIREAPHREEEND